MRQITEFSENWTLNATAPGALEYAPATVCLPFIHDGGDVSHLTLHKVFICERAPEKNLFLEIGGVSGNASVYCNGRRLCSHNGMQTAFCVLLSEKVSAGDEFIIRIEINPRPRSDGKITVGRIKLIFTGDCRFATDEDGFPGAVIRPFVSGSQARLDICPKCINATNYDIITAVVKDASGETCAVRNGKGTADVLSVPVSEELIYSASASVLGTVELSLLRDTAVLDNVILPFGVCCDALTGGEFSRNGRATSVLGVTLCDFSRMKKDIRLARETGFNSILLDGLSAKADVFSLLDDLGMTGFYAAPYMGRKSDFAVLRETVFQNCVHPSFRFVCCDAAADAEYVSAFTKTVNDLNTGVIPVMRRDVLSNAPLPENCPPMILLDVHCGIKTDEGEIAELFDRLASQVPENTAFAVNIIAPPVGGAGGVTELQHCRAHRAVYCALAEKKNVTGFFAGDIRSGAMNNGLTSDGQPLLAASLYRAVGQEGEYLKIEEGESVRVSDKNYSMVVFSDNPAFKLLVNGRPPKNPVTEKIAPYIYRIGGLRLASRVNLVEVSAGEQCDNVTVYRER